MVRDEWDRLRQFAGSVSPLICGQVLNFQVQPYGDAVTTGPWVRIRAMVQGHGSLDGAASQKVVLKLRLADWLVVKARRGTLKILQAAVFAEDNTFFLDATQEGTVVIVATPWDIGERLTLTEWFCGGFGGWGQSAFLLQKAGVPLHVGWQLDWDAEALRTLSHQEPVAGTICSPQQIPELLPSVQPVQVLADFKQDWWVQCCLYSPPLVCIHRHK